MRSRGRLSPTSNSDAAVKLFSETPKEHYLVGSDPFEAQLTIGKSFEELLHLNHDQPYEYSREDLIKMMDSEAAIVRGEKPRGVPGAF